MADHYPTTADRMMLAARTLHGAGAHRSACYLAGYVVECTLKTLLELTGRRPWGHDLESLHDEVATLLLNNNAVVAKCGDPSRLAPTMLQQIAPPKWNVNRQRNEYFCHWDPKHRYDGARWNLATTSASYISEAEKSLDILLEIVLDHGLVLS
jgi:HEPN domain-containing protein